MSASIRPSVPRPTSRTSTPPSRSNSSCAALARPSIPRPTSRPSPLPESKPVALIGERAPGGIRERTATVDLEDGDILGIAVAPIQSKKTIVPPPAPAIRVQLTRAPRPPNSPRSVMPVPVTSAPVTSAPIAPVTPASIAPVTSATIAPPASSTSLAPTVRLSANDPTDLVFDGMYGLTFARSTAEAAEMCAETLAKALAARTVIVHAHDLLTGELRAISAYGDGDFDIIGSAEPSEDDVVASAVICNQKSVTMTFDGELPKLAPRRFHVVGAPRTVVAVPALSWGRCIAMIEVIDAHDRFAGRAANSAAYVAERLAQFLSAYAA